MATRNNVQDFIRDVRAQTNAAGTIIYVGTLNADGSVKITRNGVVLYNKVFWSMGAGTAVTDYSTQGDTIDALGLDGTTQSGDAARFLASLV